jgi:hypothetical protein
MHSSSQLKQQRTHNCNKREEKQQQHTHASIGFPSRRSKSSSHSSSFSVPNHKKLSNKTGEEEEEKKIPS